MFKKYLTETLKYLFTIVVIIALVVLNWNMWSKEREQVKTIESLKRQLITQKQENTEMKTMNDDLRRRIDSLKRGSVEMIEEEARDNFGMVGEGETFFEFKGRNKVH